MKTEKTVIESISANSIRDTIGIMEDNTPDEALHLAEELLEQVEEFIQAIKQLKKTKC